MARERFQGIFRRRPPSQPQPVEAPARPNTMLLFHRMITTIGRGYEIHGDKFPIQDPGILQMASELAAQIARAPEGEQTQVAGALEKLKIHQQTLHRVNAVPNIVGQLLKQARDLV